jgi:uncharacterized protein DUF4331
VSNHFTGLKLGPPLGDQRLDLTDLYAFQSPSDDARTVLMLNANPDADALHPDAIYRIAIDTDGDLDDDVAFSFVFSTPVDGSQTVNVFMARGEQSRSPEPLGERIFTDVELSFGPEPNTVTAGDLTLFVGARSDAFYFDSEGIGNLFDTSGKRNFTTPRLDAPSAQAPWTGHDTNVEGNVCSMAIELPTSMLEATAPLRIWGRCSLRQNGTLNHVDRAGHPAVSSFFNTEDTKLEYNAGEPRHDWDRWLEQFVHLLGHTGGYTRDESIAAIATEGILPDVLTLDPSKPARYPNGHVFTDDVIDYRLAFLTKGQCPPSGLSPHTDTLSVFPYLGPPHPR